ncbi:MAG: adenylate kinase [Candidatus Nanoarchaeia archaeon]
MNLIIMGPQGSGKGTQAQKLSQKFAIPHISTGDIFRENIKNETELGKEAKEYIDEGMLVPDELTIRIVNDRLSKQDCKNGFILDGFPRNVAQAKAMDEIVSIDKVVLIDISDDEAVRRISGRRTCAKCGKVFSSKDNLEKCDKCGGELVRREDDNPDTVRKRLQIYHKNTAPLEEYYIDKLLKVDGERPVEEIFQDLVYNLS